MKDPEDSTKFLQGLAPKRLGYLARNGAKFGPYFVRVLFLLTLLALVAGPTIPQLQQNILMLELNAVVNRSPEAEQNKQIPCSRAPLANDQDRTDIRNAALRLNNPNQRALAFCLLGDYPSALVAYTQGAESGDSWSSLQEYFLQARQGDLGTTELALSHRYFSAKDLHLFYDSLTALDFNIDILPLARRAVELYPNDQVSWKVWRSAAQQYQGASDWPRALNAFLEAIHLQEKLGVTLGRSSFDLGAGRIYQTQTELQDLKSAFKYYSDAITSMNFLSDGEISSTFFYRGELYPAKIPTYTASQALQDFLHALELDPKIYWANVDAANIYLNDLKDYPSAEHYLKQAINNSPEIVYAYIILGDLYRQQGNLQSAAAEYQDALNQQPGYQAALDRLAAVQAEIQKQSP